MLEDAIETKPKEMAGAIVEAFYNILRDEIVTAISELQVLEGIMMEGDFDLGSPEDYTDHQRQFIQPYVQAFNEQLKSRSSKESA